MNEIFIYENEDNLVQVEVRFEDETVWLTQSQIVALFGSSKANISEHIRNIVDSGELDTESTVRKFRSVQTEGGRNSLQRASIPQSRYDHRQESEILSNETNNTSSIISKVWSFCNTLRDDGVGYGDYLEQLTYLLFLKMADEFSKPPYNRKLAIPKEYGWESLTARRGAELEGHYTTLLRELSRAKGHLGADIHQEPEQDSGPGQALQAHRYDRQRAMDRHGDGRQRARFTKVCWRRTPRIPRVVQDSTSRPVR